MAKTISKVISDAKSNRMAIRADDGCANLSATIGKFIQEKCANHYASNELEQSMKEMNAYQREMMWARLYEITKPKEADSSVLRIETALELRIKELSDAE